MSTTPIPITLPRSKSIVIRCLIVHYIRTGNLLPVFDYDSNDIKIVYNALKVLNSRTKTSVGEEWSVINVEDCGAAYRFLMAVLATTKGKWLLTGTQRLLERPIMPLVDFLNEHGANIKRTDLGWHIEGTELQIDDFDIERSETTQFISALMMLDAKRQKTECTDLRSFAFADPKNPYIKMTQTILQTPNLSDSHYLMYGDWSAAVFWIAQTLLTPKSHYLLKNLHFDELQGDAKIASWFSKWGLNFTEKEKGIEVIHTQTIEISEQHIDVAQTPDIAMILAVLSVCYPFQLTLMGLKNINLKESNRLDILVTELSKFTPIQKHSENEITIQKRVKELPNSFHFDSYNDHRFVMAWTLFKRFGAVEIENRDCVKKSYPAFDGDSIAFGLSKPILLV